MANPSDLNYCKIIGNFKAFIADSGDSDDLPDFVPMSGDGQIWPNVTLVKNTDLGFKSTYFNSPISVSVDADGDLSQGGRKYVMVLAGSGALNPGDFNYSISLSLSAQGESTFRSYGPFAFDVIPGGTIDLTDVLPVSASGGTPIIQGPEGPEGPEGPAGPSGAGVPAGGSALQLIRKDSTNTTTEWVTPDKTLVGLANVDNTSDANKPVSSATQTALNLKVDASAKGAANGVATLDASALVPVAQIPSSYLRLLSGVKTDRDALTSPALGQQFRRTDRNNNIQTWNGTAWKYLGEPEHYYSVSGDWVTSVSSANRVLGTVAAVPTQTYATVVRVRGGVSVSTASITTGVLSCQICISANVGSVGSAQAKATANWYPPGSNWETRYLETPWISVPASTAPLARAWINYLVGSVSTAVSSDITQSYLIVDVRPADD